MNNIYSIAVGPLFLLSLSLFIIGSFYRIFETIFFTKKTEEFIFTYISIKHSFKSIFHWLLPFATLNWRKNPILTITTFLFHFCCILTPLFLLSHVVLFEEFFNLNWWFFPALVSDTTTLVVLITLVCFFIRRVLCKEVRFVTNFSDYMLLLLIATPFFTGFLSQHQWFAYDVFLIIHIISSEVLLVLIPHTRLNHIFFFFLSRAYIGSEFGKVRGIKDW